MSAVEKEREAIARWLESCLHERGYMIHQSWLREAGPVFAERIRNGEHLKKYARDTFR